MATKRVIIEHNEEQELEKVEPTPTKKLTKKEQEKQARETFENQTLVSVLGKELTEKFYEMNKECSYDNKEVLRVLVSKYLRHEVQVYKRKITLDSYY